MYSPLFVAHQNKQLASIQSPAPYTLNSRIYSWIVFKVQLLTRCTLECAVGKYSKSNALYVTHKNIQLVSIQSPTPYTLNTRICSGLVFNVYRVGT